MSEPCPALPAHPAWAQKRDGRLVPFDAEKISRALFASTESLGKPDAFLARELTDGVVHFLAAETEGSTPTTAEIADLVIKVVRELGQPALAEAFALGQRTKSERRSTSRRDATIRLSPADEPDQLVETCLRTFTLHRVFARNLLAAHDDGLLRLTGLETPLALASLVLPPPTTERTLGEIIEANAPLAARFAIDGPEYVLLDDSAPESVQRYVRELGLGLRLTQRAAVVNLNCGIPPPWAGELADGPLFTVQQSAVDPERRAVLSDSLRETLLSARNAPGLHIDWHLAEADFQPSAADRLLRVVRQALQGEPIALAFDRPRRPVSLGEGLDRKHPAVLLTVGLGLPELAEQLRPGADGDAFVQKLGTLARLALSAAVQKREFLRAQGKKRPALGRGFLLERARLIAAPVGLNAAAVRLAGGGVCSGDAPLDLARRIAQRLATVLRQDGLASLLDTSLDSLGTGDETATGLASWDASASPKGQLRAAGALQAAGDRGTAFVVLNEDELPTAEQTADWLRWAWQHTEITRVRLLRALAAPRQLMLRIGGTR